MAHGFLEYMVLFEIFYLFKYVWLTGRLSVDSREKLNLWYKIKTRSRLFAFYKADKSNYMETYFVAVILNDPTVLLDFPMK